MERGKSSLIGLIVGMLIMAPFVFWERLTQPIPYKDVHIIEQWRDGDWLHVTATFIKTDCKFRMLVVNGQSLGIPSAPLPFIDRDVDQGDRIKGKETLRINVGGAFEFDRIFIRTRHFCAGHGDEIDDKTQETGLHVDRVFAEIDPNETIIPPDTKPGTGGRMKPVLKD
jgi:hypothetical protein